MFLVSYSLRPKPLQPVFSDSCGIRTRPSWLERPATSPEVERAVLFSQLCQRVPSTQLFIKSFLPRIFATASVASLRVDWEVLEPSSSVLQTDAIPSQLPVHLLNKTLEIGTKKPGVAQRRHRVTNVVRRLQSAECHLRLGCPNSKLQGSIFAFCNTMPFLQS